MNIEVKPRQALTILLSIIAVLLFANVLGIVAKLYYGHGRLFGFTTLFNFDTEQNIPTLYSSLALIASSILLTFISLMHKRLAQSYIPWIVLAFIFLFLSIDEIAIIHEHLVEPFRLFFNTSGLLYFAWVIPYGAVVLVIALAYLNFLKQLPKNIMLLFLVSGGIFVTGALGFELLGGRQADFYGIDNYTYALIYTCEELLEMLGIAIFIYTLLLYITIQFPHLKILIKK